MQRSSMLSTPSRTTQLNSQQQQQPPPPPNPSSSPSPFNRPFAPPPGMNIPASHNSQSKGASGASSAAGLPTALAAGLGSAAPRSNAMNFPPGNLPSATSGRALGQPSPALGFGTGRGAAGAAGGILAGGSMASSIPFGTAATTGGGSGSYPQGQIHQQQQAQGNLDPSDFPALGAGNSLPGQAEWGQASSLSSSFGGVGNRGAAPGSSQAAVGSFSTDDFPALGSSSQQQGSTNGGTAQAAAAAAEQASAAAALQHQASQREAHRISLMSSANGSPQVAGRTVQGGGTGSAGQGQQQALNAARGGFGDVDRNYATKIGSSQPAGLPALSTSTGGVQAWAQPSADGTGVGMPTSNGATSRLSSSVQQHQHQRQSQTAASPAAQILFSPADRFGLAGLLRIIKLQAGGPGAGGANGASPEDVGMLALGSDLQSLGLDVGSDAPLHSTFHTPWSSDAHPLQRTQRAMIEPDFHLPSCYNVQPPPPAQTKAANFSDETLFFIFYSTPRDALQEVAAIELHRRNWRFHKELQLWLTKEHSMAPTQKTPIFEKGQYMFWDVESWQRVTKNFVLLYEMLEDRPGQAGSLQEAMQQQQQQQQMQMQMQQNQQQQLQQQQQQQQHSQSAPITPGNGGNGEVTAGGR